MGDRDDLLVLEPLEAQGALQGFEAVEHKTIDDDLQSARQTLHCNTFIEKEVDNGRFYSRGRK